MGGLPADLLYGMDRIIQQGKEEERQELREWRDEQDRLYQAEQDRGRAISQIQTVALEGLGFARYTRNPWKRRHMNALPNGETKKTKSGIHTLIPVLVERINDGDGEALEQLRQLSNRHPMEVAHEFCVNLERLAEDTFVHCELPSETAEGKRDELRAQMRLIAAQLAGA